MENRPSWSSELAFIIAAIGSAVGLGNIWRFPYVMGQNGGAVFLIVYFFMIFFVCSIPLLAELIMGKITHKDTVGAYRVVNPKLQIFGWINVLTAVLISSFYFVVGGWIIYYILKSFSLNNIADFGTYFTELTASPFLSVILTIIFLSACTFFVFRGVNKGIEVANKFMIPLLAILLIILTLVSLNLPNAELGLKFMFQPDFSKINFSMVLAAMGQALFTLSVGMGALLTYGSYLKGDDSILKSAYSIMAADIIFSVLAGVMIFPAVFSFGLEPTAGAGLVFITLPKIFAQMQYGSFVALGFFSLLLFAALTSGISILEVAVASFIENFKMTRKKASLLMFSLVGILSVPVALSFGVLKHITLFNKTIFDIFDFVTANVFMPINSLVICLFVGWMLKMANDVLFKSEFLHKLFIFMSKYIMPFVFIALIITGLRG